MADKHAAVLLMGFGGPEGPHEVRKFVEAVAHGRNIPEERLAAVCKQYEQIGGSSPYNRLTKRQAELLQAELNHRQCPVTAYTGFQYSQPSIAQALSEIALAGIQEVVAIIMAPHSASHNRYISTLKAAPNGRQLNFIFLDSWHTHPKFIQAWSDRISQQLHSLDSATRQNTRLIFSAHSIPVEASDKSGYKQQIQETASTIWRSLDQQVAPADFVVGWQSRSGAPEEKWLEPDIVSLISQSFAEGKRYVVVAPIGFLVDHVEVLFDLDVLAAGHAASTGVTMLRCATVFDHSAFVTMLADLTQSKLEPSHVRI